MSIHQKDIGSDNPRLQCSVCGKWKRLHGVKDGKAFQRFFGSCEFTHGDHLAGDKTDVCDDCCQIECKKISELATAALAERACRVCGCTQDNACMTADGPCYWVQPDLCSACVIKRVSPAADALEACRIFEEMRRKVIEVYLIDPLIPAQSRMIRL